MKVTQILFFIIITQNFVYGNITCPKIDAQELFLDYIARGGFGVVRGNKDYVWKQILVKEGEQTLVNKEIRSMDAFKDQYDIVQFFDDQSCKYSIASYQHIMLFYKTYRYQQDFLTYFQNNYKNITIFKVLDLMIKMTLALYKFHVAGFIHADLKEENFFMMNDYTVVLGDLGLNLSLFESRNYQSGTPGYAAPEVVKKYVRTQDYTTSVDIYSLGIIFLHMVLVNFPKHPQLTLQNFMTQRCQDLQTISDDSLIFKCYMMEIIQKMIDSKAKNRTPTEGVARRLLKVMKVFYQKQPSKFNDFLNQEFRYYRSINSDSRQVERVFKEQLLDKFQQRKNFYIQEDFTIKPTLMNIYNKIEIKMPNYYKNYDKVTQPFIPKVYFSERMVAKNELKQAQEIEEERQRRIYEQENPNIVYQGLAQTGNLLYQVGVGLYNMFQNSNDQNQDEPQIQEEDEFDGPSFALADEDVTNMVYNMKQPQKKKNLGIGNIIQKQQIDTLNSSGNINDEEADIIDDEVDTHQAMQLPNMQTPMNVKQQGFLKKQFKEDFIQSFANNQQIERQPQQQMPKLRDLLEDKPYRQKHFNLNQLMQLSPRNKPNVPLQNIQNIGGYGSDDQKGQFFRQQKPMFVPLQKKYKQNVMIAQMNNKSMQKIILI